MICSNCGAEIADGSKFCKICGTAVPAAEKEAPAAPVSENDVPWAPGPVAEAPVNPVPENVLPANPAPENSTPAEQSPEDDALTYSKPANNRPAPAKPAEGPHPGKKNPPRQKKISVLPLVILLVIVLAVLGVLIFLQLTKGGKNKGSDDKAAESVSERIADESEWETGISEAL